MDSALFFTSGSIEARGPAFPLKEMTESTLSQEINASRP